MTVYVRMGLSMKKQNWYHKQLSYDEFKKFIDEARAGQENKKAFIGVINKDAAERIENVSGKKVSKIMMESEGVRHSYKKASHNLKDGDLLHIINAINTANIDDIKVSSKKHQNNECLEISKNIGDNITFVMEVRIHYGGWLALVTCYRQNKKGGATL